MKSGDDGMEVHEALMLLNSGEDPANILLGYYFEDRDRVMVITVTVPAERVRTLRLDGRAIWAVSFSRR